MNPPSIFNDVIGPVMRGPSSGHSAASVRIGLIARALMSNEIKEILIEFDEASALAATHESHGSDMGLCGGLLGFDLSDERLRNYEYEMQKSGMQIQYHTRRYDDLLFCACFFNTIPITTVEKRYKRIIEISIIFSFIMLLLKLTTILYILYYYLLVLSPENALL